MNAKKAVIIVAVLAAGVVGWQVAASEIANAQLREDLRDVAAQNGAKIGLNSPKTDDEIRAEAIRAAQAYKIDLQPEQVMVQRTGTEQHPVFDVRVEYTRNIGLPGLAFGLHFED
jgi:hypothetical protein